MALSMPWASWGAQKDRGTVEVSGTELVASLQKFVWQLLWRGTFSISSGDLDVDFLLLVKKTEQNFKCFVGFF